MHTGGPLTDNGSWHDEIIARQAMAAVQPGMPAFLTHQGLVLATACIIAAHRLGHISGPGDTAPTANHTSPMYPYEACQQHVLLQNSQ